MIFLNLLCFHYSIYQIENIFGFHLKPHGDFTNRIISIFSMLYVLYLALTGNSLVVEVLANYFVYDLIYMIPNFKSYSLFIVHHIFSLLLLYIGYNQNFGSSIYIIFETTSPLLHITKISKLLVPNTTSFFKKLTKTAYFLFRVVSPPVWLLHKSLTVYNNSWTHFFIFSQITILWLASIVWWRKMKS